MSSVRPEVSQPTPMWEASLLLAWVTGEFLLALALSLLRAGGPLAAGYADEDGRRWLSLWAVVLSLPLRLAAGLCFAWVIRGTGEASLGDMGLTARRAGLSALLAVALTLPLVAAVYSVNAGCEALAKRISDGAQEHPFNDMARRGATATEWAVLIVAAVVAAPLWEEFLFRGLVQAWAVRRRWAGAILMGMAVFLAVAFRYDEVSAGWRAGGVKLLVALTPALAALALVPVYLGLRAWCRSPAPAGVFAAAVLFGWFHVRVWPSPVPLTLLGLGLGWISWHTRSLVGPVLLHAAFNAVAVVMLVWTIVRG